MMGTFQPIRPVEIPDYVGIQRDRQQLAMGKEQLKAAQTSNKQHEIDANEQQILTQAAKDNFDPAADPDANFNKVYSAVQGKVRPQTLDALQKGHIQTQKDLAELDDKKLVKRNDQTSRLSALAQQAQSIPDEQYAQQWPQIAQAALEIRPELKGRIDPSQPVPKDQLGNLTLALMTQEQYGKQEEQKRAAAKAAEDAAAAKAKLPGEIADSTDKENTLVAKNLGAATTPEQWQAAKIFLKMKGVSQQTIDRFGDYSPENAASARNLSLSGTSEGILSMRDWLSKNPGKGPADYEKWKAGLAPGIRNYYNRGYDLTGGGGAGAGTGAAGAAAGTNGTLLAANINQVPPQLRGTVQAILDYRAAMPSSSRGNATNMAVRSWVNKLDPKYDETSYPAISKIVNSYTSGPTSREINAVNTAMGHVGVLGDAIDALKNGDVQTLNRIGNALGVQVGKDAVTTFKTIVHRVGPELAAAYIQGGGGEHERGTTQADFDSSLGTDQLKSNVAITAKLLRSKIGALENQWKNTTHRDDFQQRFITPEAQDSLNKYSPQKAGGGKIVVTAPDGSTHPFDTQAQADAFKKLAGIK